MDLVIRNGRVFDPLNGVNGEVKDVFISGGKIAAKAQKNAKTIDASGKAVFPGGVDIHSHFAGAKVNMGRLFRPEDHLGNEIPARGKFRAGSGFIVPSTWATGYKYAEMGYTTVNEPAVPPLTAIHTHEEFIDTPIIDKLGLLLLGNNHQLIEYISKGEKEKATSLIAWMLSRTKTYGIKAANPGGTFAWGWGKNVKSLDDPVPYFEVTPAEIIKELIRINRELKLPHTVHLHTNNLGHPGNFETALKTMKFSPLHITHLQFSSYGGDSWKTFSSEAEKLARAVNGNKGISIDLGQVVYGDVTTMTADAPFEFGLSLINRQKWSNGDIENETSGGVVPYYYSRKSGVNSVQWTIGLELALRIKNPWQAFITTDNPNAGVFTHYPKIIAWLMSKKYRDQTMERSHKWASSRTGLGSLDRELTLEEIAIMTRAGPAKRLGLDLSLKEGNPANIAIYDISPEERDGKKIEKAFSSALYTIKDGKIVVKGGEVVDSSVGKTYYVSPEVTADIEEDIRKRFLYYTVNVGNYGVDMDYLPNPVEVKTNG
ncbi:MAG: formylmethanofuran dehydrogenase subunit A [Candidatus Altiarchaeales archaeon]|nr:formylmethanofuran dehydrogenase subunit A [Candidatus Altiarchaeota archaeon]MBU4437648.1 formylmethanofuran dehydrogenase subunit A [Candidatus Altiarchaeota archaeon]MCG2782193.1 formylmethanofuran dehydrogenase subunit A [Candidatus Altiarchaeales archaeon]